MSVASYRKFCYWTGMELLQKICEKTVTQGSEVEEEMRIPCRVLRASTEIGYVTPAAWNGFCKRRTSWYWKSDKANKFLLVSSYPVEIAAIGDPIVITESDFKPGRLPSREDRYKLIQSKEYQSRKPSAWEKVEPLDREFYRKWFDTHRPQESFDFDTIFVSHCANHSNFISPEFFVMRDGLKVPYSISDSIQVCSSCVEFFNILGSRWPLKYVVPCIGAVQFARLPRDRYFEVTSLPDRDRGGL
jgi:hypothetical protein